jgi:hypothetical protein
MCFKLQVYFPKTLVRRLMYLFLRIRMLQNSKLSRPLIYTQPPVPVTLLKQTVVPVTVQDGEELLSLTVIDEQCKLILHSNL